MARYRGYRTRQGMRKYGRRLRRYIRRRSYGRVKTLGSQMKVYSFKRTVQLRPFRNVDDAALQQTESLLTNFVASQYFNEGSFSFRLTDLPNYTDFTNMYEKFKLTGVKIKFIPVRGTEAEVSGSGAASISPLAIAIQRSIRLSTDANPTFNSIIEQQDCKIISTHRPYSVYIPYPKFSSSAAPETYGQEKSGWLNTAHGEGTVHHGLVYAFQQTRSQDIYTTQWRIFATYYVKCANPK